MPDGSITTDCRLISAGASLAMLLSVALAIGAGCGWNPTSPATPARQSSQAVKPVEPADAASSSLHQARPTKAAEARLPYSFWRRDAAPLAPRTAAEFWAQERVDP